MRDFEGLKAVVTGGGSGIGAATARLLANRGAAVAVLDLDPAAAVSAGLHGFKADVRDDASVRAAVASALDVLGGLDVLVNNACIGAAGTVEDNPDEQWMRVYDVNVVGMVRVTRAALPALRQSQHAAIVNTCSIAATAGLPQRAALEARQPMGRLVSADEVAAAIAYLASPTAASVTGTSLAVDGGMAGLRLRPVGQ